MIDYNDQPLHRLDPAYLEHYGLMEPPFSAMVDERFYFNTPEASQRMSLMVHMTQYSDMVLIVLGDEGMGKTTLLQNYIKAAHDNWHICRINANTMMDKDQLLFRIAEDFGLESLPADSAELQELLYDKMTQLHQNDVLPVIIVDDAHELPVDAVSQLFIMAEIKAGDVTMVHIVLFAEPLIEKTINASNVRKIRERIGHTFELAPFDEADTAEYILNRMTIAGLRDENPFSTKVVRQIHKQSHGNPARINELAHIALDEAEGGNEPEYDDVQDDHFDLESDSLFTPMRVFSVLAIATIAGLGLWQQDRINQIFTGTQEMSTKLAVEASAPRDTTNDHAISPFAKLKEKIFRLGTDKQQTTRTAEAPDKTPDLARIEDPAIAAQLETAAPAPVTPVIERIEPAKLIASSDKQTITIHGQHFNPDTEVNLSWSGKQKTLSKSRLRLTGDNKIRFDISTGNQPDDWQITLSNPGAGTSNTAGFQVAAAVTPKPKTKPQTAAQWVDSQPAKNLTLQLLGSHSLKPINKYIKQHQLAGEAMIYKTRRDNKDWYVLFYGSFDNAADAQQTINHLPASAKTNKPWVRSFASIRAQNTKTVSISTLAKATRGKN